VGRLVYNYVRTEMKLGKNPHVAHELRDGHPSAIVFSVSAK